MSEGLGIFEKFRNVRFFRALASVAINPESDFDSAPWQESRQWVGPSYDNPDRVARMGRIIDRIDPDGKLGS